VDHFCSVLFGRFRPRRYGHGLRFSQRFRIRRVWGLRHPLRFWYPSAGARLNQVHFCVSTARRPCHAVAGPHSSCSACRDARLVEYARPEFVVAPGSRKRRTLVLGIGNGLVAQVVGTPTRSMSSPSPRGRAQARVNMGPRSTPGATGCPQEGAPEGYDAGGIREATTQGPRTTPQAPHHVTKTGQTPAFTPHTHAVRTSPGRSGASTPRYRG